MQTIKLILAVIAVVTATWFPNDASAWFKFCNKTSKSVFVNLVMPTSQCAQASHWGGFGWWNIPSGQCQKATTEALGPGWPYYYYARTHDSASIWSGQGAWQFWMPGAAHTPWCLGWPNGASGDVRSHREIVVDATNFIIDLRNSSSYCFDQGCFYSDDQCLCPH